MALRKDIGGNTTPGTGPSSVRNPYGPEKLASAGVNSTNGKTGVCMATFASQASCPDGTNNKSSFVCPLYGQGCYAESGMTAKQVKDMNERAGGKAVQHKGNAESTPEDVARDEAAAISSIKKDWDRKRQNDFVRVHVVGDGVTPESAKIVADALRQYSKPMPGGIKNIWNYTHGWRDVSRSEWGDHISVLASVDNSQDLSRAHGKGYACAMVVPSYLQAAGQKVGVAYKINDGFTIVPCPFEVERIVDASEMGMFRALLKQKGIKIKRKDAEIRQQAKDAFSPAEMQKIKEDMAAQGLVRRNQAVQCITCKLCMGDERLKRNKLVIAFAAHGSRAGTIVKNLVNIDTPTEGVA